jgi:hypothetical protein
MFLEVVRAKYISDYKIEIEFNNGEVCVVDLINELNGAVFLPLRDKSFFKEFTIVYNTIEWKNGADFAPEYLHDLARTQQQIASEPAPEYSTKKTDNHD